MKVQVDEELRGWLGHDPRWRLVERIVATPSFAKSPRLSSLLLFVARESLNGRPEELREQLIGERVFGRSAGYDPRDDNIVRSHASRLRQRLDTYFREEAVGEELRVTIPRGSYVPLFERIESSPAAEPTADPGPVLLVERAAVPPVDFEADPPAAARPLVAGGLPLLLMLLLAIVGGWWFVHQRQRDVGGESGSPTHRLWAAMFSNSHDTLVVPADSSLVLLKSFIGHSIDLADYANGQYLADIVCRLPCDPLMLRGLAQHRYTSIADLKFAVDVTHMPEALANRTEIRYARDLQLEDLKQKNLILIGSLDADPWLGLFESKMNFILNDDEAKEPLGILNRKPLAGEQAEYLYDNRAPAARGFATIAFLPNLSGTGNVLVVQGFTLAGTQAAAEFITNGAEFDTLLGPIVGGKHVFPHFEILLQTLDVNGTASHPVALAYRVY